MDDLQMNFLLQYLLRYPDDLETQLNEKRKNMNLKYMDAVDIIEFIELRASYATACQMAGDIGRILSWKL